MTLTVSGRFPRYTDHDPLVPVRVLTPGAGRTIHRFFDTDPISPSGRYLAATRLPFEDRLPDPGNLAQVVLVDLHTADERVVAETAGWEPQLGANVNWGPDDRTLLFADVDTRTWTPFTAVLDPHAGTRRRLDAPLYHASPDGRRFCGTEPAALQRTQRGYGVVVPPPRVPQLGGPRDDVGLHVTDTATGVGRLVVSTADMVRLLDVEDPDAHDVYPFHAKFSPDGRRVLVSLRWHRHVGPDRVDLLATKPRDGGVRVDFAVFTCDPAGDDLRLAVGPDAWRLGGHHVNWLPGSDGLSMNLRLAPGGPMRFVRADLDGRTAEPMHPRLVGSGHPSVHRGGRYVVTDCYGFDRWARPDGTTPLRWCDLHTGMEREVVRLPSVTPAEGGTGQLRALRADPHPAWHRDGRHVVFNSFLGGTRRIMLADMGLELSG